VGLPSAGIKFAKEREEDNMAVTLGEQIAQNMRQKTTEELLAIWESNDRLQWSDVTFEVIQQTLSERGITAPGQGDFAAQRTLYDPRYKGVRGWLLFFCISLTVFNPLTCLAGIEADLQLIGRLSSNYSGLRTMSFVECILSLAIAGYSIYAGVGLWRVEQGAVGKARIFLLCSLAYHVTDAFLPFMAGLSDAGNKAMIPEAVKSIIQGLVYFGVWGSYLNSSKRVKATYGL
jgi:hypothetical protein